MIKFTFVRAVEKKIVSIRDGEEINGEALKHISGNRDRPIYIRATEDLTHYISNQEVLEIEDDIPDVDLPPFSSFLDDSEANYIDIQPLDEDHDRAAHVGLLCSDTSTTCSAPVVDVPEEPESQLCPVCQNHFPMKEIIQHASLCIDARAGPSTLDETARPGQSTLDGYFTEEQPHKSLSSELSKKRQKYVRGQQHPVKFVIRRNNVVRDVMKKMAIFFSEDTIQPITVEFVGEEAVDEGGPLRELFTAFYDEVPQVLMQGT